MNFSENTTAEQTAHASQWMFSLSRAGLKTDKRFLGLGHVILVQNNLSTAFKVHQSLPNSLHHFLCDLSIVSNPIWEIVGRKR